MPCFGRSSEIQSQRGADGLAMTTKETNAAPAMTEILEALVLANHVLSLLEPEVKALGHRAENVRAKVRAAIGKIEGLYE